MQYVCNAFVIIGIDMKNKEQERLINDQLQPVRTEDVDAGGGVGDDHRVSYAIDKTPPLRPSRMAKTKVAKKAKNHCSQHVHDLGYGHHQRYRHLHAAQTQSTPRRAG